MTGKWGARETLMTVGAVILALTIAYYVGKKTGRTDARLEINSTQLKKSDENIKTVQSRTDSATRHSDTLVIYRANVREKVAVQHDSIIVHDSLVVVSPEIAQLIIRDDSLISALKGSLALQDTLIGSLRVGLNLRDQRIRILESQGPQRISKGFQVGVGVCRTSTKREPCVYVGYGFQVRLP